jgi:hypothetical protein
MRTLKHTQGPWEVFNTPSGYRLIEYHDRSKGSDGRISIARMTGDVDEATELANANLVAAAPEAIEKLQKCIDWFIFLLDSWELDHQQRDKLNDHIEEIQRLIMKATGGVE